MPTVADSLKPELDRILLRRAGEHIGTLAERAHERLILQQRSRWIHTRIEKHHYETWQKLDRLSREILEIANG